jgi:hypothetical protein
MIVQSRIVGGDLLIVIREKYVKVIVELSICQLGICYLVKGLILILIHGVLIMLLFSIFWIISWISMILLWLAKLMKRVNWVLNILLLAILSMDWSSVYHFYHILLYYHIIILLYYHIIVVLYNHIIIL